MTVFAFGASYDGVDKTPDFVQAGVACIGWSENDAPYAHQMLRRITVGDIVVIKSYAPKYGLAFKAVGLVTEPHDPKFWTEELGHAVRVEWHPVLGSRTLLPHHVGVMNDKADYVRRGTLYEELNPELQRVCVDLLLARQPRQVVSPGGFADEAA